jgi:hypothetical protein
MASETGRVTVALGRWMPAPERVHFLAERLDVK